MVTKLPTRYRQARNIDKGYEIRLSDAEGGEWVPVVSALHIAAPIAMTSFTVERNGEVERLAAVHPNVAVMSRRPAS
jgi:hypothetical protein